MGKLIDIDRLCDDLVKRWSVADKKKEDLIRAVMADVVTPIVVSQPPVDAVPVVRCRDCKHHDGIRCFRWNSTIITGFDDFCSNGERKDGNDD